MEINTPWLKNKATGIVSVKAPVGDTRTVSGNPVSIDNPSGLTALTGLNVDIQPVQDLNGYDSPWVGGAGKNLFPNNATNETKTANGITIKAENGVYTISGTATASTDISFTLAESVDMSPSTNKICFLNNNANTKVALYFRRNGENVHYWEMNSANRVARGWTQTADETVNTLRFYMGSGSAIDMVVSPMLVKLADENPTVFEPYENICPITGHTSATVQRTVDGSSTDYTIDLNGTVYGGTLDVLTGVLTVTHVYKSFTSADSLGANHYAPIWRLNWNGATSDAKAPSSTAVTNIMSNCFKAVPEAQRGQAGTCFISGVSKWIQFDISDTGISTANEAKAYFFSLNPVIVYELATPTTVQLTAQQVSLLTGTNIISTDMESVTVTTLSPDWQSLIDPSSMKVSRYDLDAGETTGRNLEGYMLRDRQAVKEKIEMEFPPMYASDFHTMMELTKEQSFYVWYYSPYYGQWRAADMYVGDREGNLYYGYDSGHAPEQMWTDIKFNFIER